MITPYLLALLADLIQALSSFVDTLTFDQVGIALTGAIAIFLTNDDRHHVRRWAPVFGLCGQPFWVYSTIHAQQWGIFLLTFWYMYAWARGIYNLWVKPYVAERRQRV